MKIITKPFEGPWQEWLRRPELDQSRLFETVREVLEQVRLRGDQALAEYTERFDKARLDDFRVSAEEFAAADRLVPEALKRDLRVAMSNIEAFHSAQWEPEKRIQTQPGVTCWRRMVPIDRVGLYVPGGTAPLFSTVLMLGVPARVAGCPEVVLCSPPSPDGSIHPAILWAAQLVGIRQVFKLGGIQAIGAMAYGTQSVPKVFKIFGPGNQYVTAAKQWLNSQGMAIDMPAGPSEVAVMADDSARVDFVAADLLSQAEHGHDSQVLLVTTCPGLAQALPAELERQLAALPRHEMARSALANSKALVVESDEQMLELINHYAPEHLIVATRSPEELAARVRNAGSVFIGHLTPESAGDYASGTNHTLPTNGHAMAYSGVSLDSFVKKITYQMITPDGLRQLGPTIENLAENELLLAHKNAVSIRLKSLDEK